MEVDILDRATTADRADGHPCASSPRQTISDSPEAAVTGSHAHYNFIKKTIRSHGSHILGFLAAALFIAAFWPAFSMLWKAWMRSEDYTHAPITIPIIAYMVWRTRPKLAGASGNYAWFGLVLTIAASAIYLFALLTQVQTFVFLSTYLVVIGVVVYLAGVDSIKTLSTPLFLLLLLIPFPQQLYSQLTFPLQLFVSRVSESIVMLLDVPLFREGNVMHLPDMSFEVVEACSGLRSVIILMSLSIVIGYFFLRRFPSKLVLFLSSIPTAILVNTARITVMILFFHFFKNDLSEGTLHTATGIVVLILAVLILLVLQKALFRWEIKSA